MLSSDSFCTDSFCSTNIVGWAVMVSVGCNAAIRYVRVKLGGELSILFFTKRKMINITLEFV